jgi:hypothetical protein
VTVPHSRTLLAAAFLLVASRFGLTQSLTPAQLSAAELVKAVIHNELHPPANSDVRWKYRVEKESDGKRETRAVIETKDGSLYRLLAVAGKPLSAADESSEAMRILRFSQNSEEQRKAEQARRKDMEQCNTFLQMIPDAFVFEYAGQNSNSTRLTFKPNPRFRPPSREGKVLQQMAGEMWVDTKQQRLVSIVGQLVNDVKFSGGLLGHLQKGGQFTVRRAEIAQGDWEMTELTVNMRGRALLFKNICVQQKEVHSSFQRVPDDLTLADAANLLLHQSVVALK